MSINNLSSLLSTNSLASLLLNPSITTTATTATTDTTTDTTDATDGSSATDSTEEDARTQALLSIQNFMANDPLLQELSSDDSDSNNGVDPLITLAEQAVLMPTYNALGLIANPGGSATTPGSVNLSG
jgi:hypothetical protein